MPIRHTDSAARPGLDRRRFLTGALSLTAATGLAAAGLMVPAAVAPEALALTAPDLDDVGVAPLSYPALFETSEFDLGNPLRHLPKARTLVDSLAPRARAGAGAPAARWERAISELAAADPRTRIEEVNRFVNRVRYVTDRRNWGVSDRWATPDEFFARGAGDCEDFAVAKFVSLHRLGFNHDRLRIVLARDQRKRLDHAFLVVYLADGAYVLDNQIAAVTVQSAISYYRPLCSFNDHRLWMHRV